MKNKCYLFRGEASGELYSSKNIVDFYKKIKDIKEFDRSNGIKDTYVCEIEYELEDEPNALYTDEIKVYVRNKKVFVRRI